MKIRTTERKHNFTKELFDELNIFSLESLTMNENDEFTSCIEGIDFENENINLNIIFTHNQIQSKLFLSNLLDIPFYLMVHSMGVFFIYEVIKNNGESVFQKRFEFNEDDFVGWWRNLKGHKQNKPYYEPNRINNSIFDIVIEKRGFSWGGNVDGFMFKSKKIVCIIENIYTQKNPINSEKGDPRTYFKSKGPNFNSWKPIVILSIKLNIPLFLFTWDGKSEDEKIGFSIIDKLTYEDIFYRYNIPPYKQIIEGKTHIKNFILNNLNESPPVFHK
jgi:hypothetical protein